MTSFDLVSVSFAFGCGLILVTNKLWCCKVLPKIGYVKQNLANSLIFLANDKSLVTTQLKCSSKLSNYSPLQ